MTDIFKVNNQDTRTMSGASIVNFEHYLVFYSTVIIDEFEQKNSAWA